MVSNDCRHFDTYCYIFEPFIDKWENISRLLFFLKVPVLIYQNFLVCHGAHHLCSHRGTPVILQSGHHVRAKTNSPIFGVLTQPVPSEWSETNADQTFVESSNIEFLQAAGARVVHLDYRLSQKEMRKELA